MRHLIHPSMCSSFWQILLLLSLIGASLTYIDTECLKLSADKGCTCSYEWFHWTVKCPGVEIYIKSTLKNEKFVHIELWSEIENNSIPIMNLGNCRAVAIVNCELSGVPIVHLLDQLGIKNVEYLSIHNNTLGVKFNRPSNGLCGLNLNSNGLPVLPADIFTDLSNVDLPFIYQNLVELPMHTFGPLGKLTKLDLAKNRLNQLPNGIFRNRHQLKYLMLNDNQLRNINKNLSILHINDNRNKLKFLPGALFANLSHLQEVHISCSKYSRDKNIKLSFPRKRENLIWLSCGFSDISGNLFTSSSNWGVISLAGNNLCFLPDSIFADQHYLKQLDLSHNKLQSLQHSLFENTSRLRLLDLSYNQLTKLPVGIFLSLGSLKRLWLHNNELHSLPDGLFLKTTNLVDLHLSYNQLIEISAEIFSPLVKLEVLYLDDNHLKTISPDTFSKSRNIRYINMENNHINLQEIASFDTPFYLPEKLETLKLRNNSIQHIYWNWRTALPNLKELDLSFNNITMLIYRDLTFKQNGLFVNLSHNQVRTIDFEEENLMNEISYILIDFSYNPLDCDCKLMSFLLHLRRTPYSKARFVTDSLFCDKPDKRRLRLFRDLKPVELPCFIGNCPHGCICWERTNGSTLIFNCSNTNLTKVPVLPIVQATLFKAIVLHIENNELNELPIISIGGYANVTKIYATGNNISQITVHNLPTKLTYLDLSHNNLKRFDPDVIHLFSGSYSLTQLTLAGNPWDCNCDSRLWLLFAERQFFVTDYKKMFCAAPKNATMYDYIFDKDICQEDHRAIFISTVSFLGVSLLISMAVTVSYKYETEIKIWIYSCPWLRGIFSEFDEDEDKKYDAFVSYSHKDREFIGTTLVPELERDGPICYKLCVHVRDFMVGDYIIDQIVRAIDESRRTIFVLSKHFIASVWACMENRLAHQAAVKEGRTRVIVIMYGDIGDIDSLEPTLREYLKTNTYLEWGDPQFWDRLRYAMPHPVNAPPNQTYQATNAV